MAIPRTLRVIPALLLLLASAAFAANRWQPAGPEGGNVTSLAIDPANPRVLYAGVGAGGVFKSVDAGATWNPAFDGLAGNAVLALARLRERPARSTRVPPMASSRPPTAARTGPPRAPAAPRPPTASSTRSW